MNKKMTKPVFIILLILSLIVFIVSFYDILYEKGLMIGIFALYTLFIIISLVLLVIKQSPDDIYYDNATTNIIKKSQENVHHFKCPECNEIFAIKKSNDNTSKPFTLTCPACGIIGRISPSSEIVVDIIPKNSSDEIVFTCHKCKQNFSIWAKGTDISNKFQVYSCPYCGKIHES